PAVLGVVLPDLLLGGPEDGERGGVVDYRPGAGGALVDGEDHRRTHVAPRRGKGRVRRCGTWYHGGPAPPLHQSGRRVLFLCAARAALPSVPKPWDSRASARCGRKPTAEEAVIIAPERPRKPEPVHGLRAPR